MDYLTVTSLGCYQPKIAKGVVKLGYNYDEAIFAGLLTQFMDSKWFEHVVEGKEKVEATPFEKAQTAAKRVHKLLEVLTDEEKTLIKALI